jgi:HSP20 family protein
MANLIRFNDPFAGLTSMHSQLDDLFNNFFNSALPAGTHGLPAMDVYTEDDKALVAEVQAPGFDKDDMEISLNNGLLEIKAEKHQKEEDKSEKRNYMMRESHASFYRSIALPKHADPDNIEAEFENGVLKVRVPFKDLPAPKKVAISSGKKSNKDKSSD